MVERNRIGKRPGERLTRISAIARAMISTATSTTMKIFTSSQKPLRTSGKAFLNSLQLKKGSRTVGQPGVVRRRAARPPITTTEEATAISVLRRALARLASSRSRRRSPEGRSPEMVAGGSVTRPGGASVEFRRVGGLAHPPLRDLFEFARFFERFDRPGDARGQRRFFRQQRAPFFAFG